MNENNAMRTKKLILAGLFAALTAVCSWINISLFFTPVPINLALIGPYMAGLVLGSKFGFFSEIIYVLLGSIGLPVFAGFTGGLDKLVGPTGGFIVGYMLCALICGLELRHKGTKFRVLLMILGLAACYACGLIWFMFVTHSALWAGLTSCVLPFLPGDAVKITAVAILVRHLPKVE